MCSVAWSADGKVASGSGDTTIKIWNTNTGQCVSTLTGHHGTVVSVSFSPCATKIVSGGGDVYRQDAGIRIWDAKTGSQIGSPLEEHSRPVWSVAWNNDGTKLASAGALKVCIWSVGSAGTFEHQSTFECGKHIHCVAFSPDGKILAAGEHCEPGNVRLYDPVTGDVKSTLSGHLR